VCSTVSRERWMPSCPSATPWWKLSRINAAKGTQNAGDKLDILCICLLLNHFLLIWLWSVYWPMQTCWFTSVFFLTTHLKILGHAFQHYQCIDWNSYLKSQLLFQHEATTFLIQFIYAMVLTMDGGRSSITCKLLLTINILVWLSILCIQLLQVFW
jgi:hypothetical protein